MGAYSMNFGNLNPFQEMDIDSLLEDNEIKACYEESSMDAAARIMSETTYNWNAIIEACAIDELNYLEENSSEMVYEGAKLDSFIEKAKDFFRNIWHKIQEFFKKALMQFNAWFQSDKEFIKKYEKDLNLVSNRTGGFGDKEIKWYYYEFYDELDAASKHALAGAKPMSFDGVNSLNDAAKIIDSLSDIDISGLPADTDPVDKWKKYNEDIAKSENKTTIYNKIRATYFDENNTEVEANEFAKLLKEAIQGGDSKDDVKLSVAVGKAVPFLKASAAIKTNLNKMLNINKKSIDNAISCLDRIKRDLNKDLKENMDDAKQIQGYKHSIATTFIELLKGEKNILIQANGIIVGCLKSASRQAKAICVHAINYKKPKNESGMLQFENEGSLLEQVRFN